MLEKTIGLLLLCLASYLSTPECHAQRITPEGYIQSFRQEAIRNMQLKRVPASITLAQGMLESGYGNSPLAIKANNHFGIKCHSGWSGKRFYQDDDQKNECFRKYPSVLDSYADHADFLTGRSRYASLFQLEITDYKGWAKGLKAAGYATNPQYAQKLIALIERYELYRFDRQQSDLLVDAGTSTETGQKTIINGLEAVVVGRERTLKEVATKVGTSRARLRRYNELPKNARLNPGDILYLELKTGKAPIGVAFHTVSQGDTPYNIAQKYGLQLRALANLNHLKAGSMLQIGETLHLRNKRPKY